ncbi:MAG: DUF418 domain-containing protein [Gemmatimonadales bacterium]|nr:MAG: DUF418 domain-containing protein [Gemmatimonadales bacterium]
MTRPEPLTRAAAPVRETDRIAILDILRGFAILGILVVNMRWFNTPVGILTSELSLWDRPVDQVVKFLVYAVFDAKFYVLFSMLFGYGFWLFMNKSLPPGKSVVRLFSIRLFILLLIGAAHVTFLWPGDILVFYALVGFVLILFRNVRDRTLLRWAVGVVAAPVIFLTLVFLGSLDSTFAAEMQTTLDERTEAMRDLADRALVIYASGSFGEIVAMRLDEYRVVLEGVLFFHVNILAYFLVGQWAARKGILANVEAHLPLLRRLLLWGLVVGIPVNLFYGYVAVFGDLYALDGTSLAAAALTAVGSPLLTLAYVAGFILLVRAGHLEKLSRGLAAVGRMALTNYLAHSVIAALLFHSYGLGLYGAISPAVGLVVVAVIFGLQIPFSLWWLERYRFGPAEWLWRTLTYRKLQPIRRG